LGKVPALEFDDGSVMFESPAILQVLAEMYPDSNLDCPAGHRDHRRFLELFGFAETLASEIETLNMQHLFLRDPKDVSLSVMKINTARVKAALKVLDTMLDDQDWLCSSGFSAADIMMSYIYFRQSISLILACFRMWSIIKSALVSVLLSSPPVQEMGSRSSIPKSSIQFQKLSDDSIC